MRALEFIRDHVTFKLPYDFSYQMKTPIIQPNLTNQRFDLQLYLQLFNMMNHRKKNHWRYVNSSTYFTTSWGGWKHLFGTPGVRHMVLKPKLHKKSKNGFKTINYRRYPVMIFSKNWFRRKKIIKKIRRLVDFWIFMATPYVWMN